MVLAHAFFFFSSRRRHTRLQGDWSSDVCSSDLRHTYRTRWPWALPGGWVRRGENPAQALVREIREETTLEVEVLAPLTVQMESPTHMTVIYGARLVGGAFRPSAEVAEVRFLEPGVWPVGLRADHFAIIESFGWGTPGGRTIA